MHVVLRFGSVVCLIAALFGFIWLNDGDSTSITQTAAEPQCGHWSILRCCELLGAPVDMPTLMSMLPFEPEGHSVLQLSNVLEKIGLHVEGRRETLETLAQRPMPCIAHMGKTRHFVVIDGVANDRVHLFDCWGRRTSRKSREFVNDWSGHALLVSRDPARPVLPAFVVPAPEPAARIQFEATFVDKGEIRPSEQVVPFIYHLRNVGDRNLEIKALHKNCSCIEAKKPDAPIPPGGMATVELAFKTAGREGAFFHQVLLESNDPLLPVAKLKATGYIDTGVTALPPRVDFGDIGLGEERSIICIVKYAGGSEEFAVGAASCESAVIEVREFNPDSFEGARLLWPEASAKPIAHSVRRLFVVSLRPTPEQVGEIHANVTVETNVDGFERLVIPVTGRVVRPVRLYPATLSFGEVAAADRVERVVTAVSPVTRAFRVVGTAPEHVEVKVSAKEINGGNEMELSFTATGAAALALADTDFALDVEMTDTGERFKVPLHVYALDADRSAPPMADVNESGS